MLMTDEEIRVAAAEQLKIERRQAGAVTETTPASITPAVEAFARSLGGDGLVEIPVVDDANGRYGWCNDGVRLKVAADGGRAVYGWTIWEWPPVLLTAEFHCVWRSPAGDLLDITPKPRRETSVVFVPDLSYPIDFNFDHRPRNRRMRIYEGKDRSGLVEMLRQGLSGAQRAYEERRAAKAGLAFDEWIEGKVPQDLLPQAVDELIAACEAFEAHYDSLGPAGEIRIDSKFRTLLRARMGAQDHLRSLLAEHRR